MVATTVSLPDFWAGFIVGILFCVGIFVASMIISYKRSQKTLVTYDPSKEPKPGDKHYT